MRISQYQVNYSEPSNLTELEKLGNITYSSKVLNFILLTSHKSSDTIRETEGVTFVKLLR